MHTDQCLILAGGYGSRLRKITKKIPKPLIKINKKPFIFYLIKNLYSQGIRNFIILTHYKNDQFSKKIPRKYRDATIQIIREKKKLGTLGAIINSKKKLNNSFFVVNGDSYLNFNIRDLEYNVLNNSFEIGVALIKTNDNSEKLRYFFNKRNNLSEIDYSKNNKKLICGGVYYLRKKNITKLRKNNTDIDKDLILKKKDYKKKIFAKFYNVKSIDIGTPKSLKLAKNFIKKIIIKPCAFLDKDGVINEDLGYVHKKKNTLWKKNIFKAVKFLNDNGYRVIVVTNQAGIAKGYYSEKTFLNYMIWVQNQFYKKGCFFDGIYYSPFHPNAKLKKFRKISNLRKPGNGMIINAFKDWEIKRNKSFLIGDNIKDLTAAKKSKIRGFFVEKDILTQVKQLIKISK